MYTRRIVKLAFRLVMEWGDLHASPIVSVDGQRNKGVVLD